MIQKSEYFPGERLNAVNVRDLAAQSREDAQQTATPGRWTLTPQTRMDPFAYISAPDGDGNIKNGVIASLFKKDAPGEQAANARFICAAVNGAREALPDMTDAERDTWLEAGYMAEAIEQADEQRRRAICAEAALAECREALRLLHDETSYVTPTPAPLVEARIHARAILARLDAQE